MDKHTVSGKEKKKRARVEQHSQATSGNQVVAFKMLFPLSTGLYLLPLYMYDKRHICSRTGGGRNREKEIGKEE